MCVGIQPGSSPCRKGIQAPFPRHTHKMPGEIWPCSARSVAAAKASGSQAAGPKETSSASLGWGDWGRSPLCCPVPAFQRHSSIFPGFGGVSFPSYGAECSSLINSVPWSHWTRAGNCQMCQVLTNFFIRNTDLIFKPSPETKGCSVVLSLDCRENRSSLMRI